MPVILSIIALLLVVGALVDIIVRDDAQVRHLPKFAWILLVIVLPLIGSIVWFAIGHDWSATIERTKPRQRSRPAPVPAPSPVHDPRSTEEQLAELEREIEDYERIRRLEAELEERRRKQTD